MSAPIFIHSLFRSGSTWLFDLFRRAGAGYWCYQEPFHETLRALDSDPESVVSVHTDVARSLRHPTLEKPYFYEIYALREYLRGSFHARISFASFFDPLVCPAFDDYTGRLIRHAQGHPVLQCCRSFGRVAHLRQQHGGTHIHLWRNPWDQWWSYQINDYFDLTSLAILHAHNAPPVIKLLKDELGIDNEFLRGYEDDFSRLGQVPISLENRYLAFYGLWLYSLIENRPQATVDINIDQLTTDAEYRARTMVALESHGIVGLDFSNCTVPQAQFGSEDREFFGPVQRRVHQLFAIAGYDITVLHNAVQLQAATQPQQKSSDMAGRDAIRSRDVVRRYAHHAFAATRQRIQASTQATRAELERDAALAKAEAAEVRTRQSLDERDAALAKVDQLHGELRGLYASKSWRVTLPLRRAVRLLKFSLRPILLIVMRWILRHSRIKAGCSRLLGPFPRVRARLRALADHHGLLKAVSASSETQDGAALEPEDNKLHQLGCCAREDQSQDLVSNPAFGAPAQPLTSSRAAEIYTRLLTIRASNTFRGHD